MGLKNMVSEKTKVPITWFIASVIFAVSTAVGLSAWGIRLETRQGFTEARIQSVEIEQRVMQDKIHDVLIKLEKNMSDIKVSIETMRRSR